MQGKIQRENDMIEASMRMRQGTSNVSVHQQLDSKIREGQKNISYLQDSLNKLQISQSASTGQAPPPISKNESWGGLEPGFQPSLPSPRPSYALQSGPGVPKTRNYTKLGKSPCFLNITS